MAWRTLGQRVLIIDARINQEVHDLNEVGAFVWDLCDGDHTIDEIVQKVQAEFEVSQSMASDDVEKFLSDLGEKGLLE